MSNQSKSTGNDENPFGIDENRVISGNYSDPMSNYNDDLQDVQESTTAGQGFVMADEYDESEPVNTQEFQGQPAPENVKKPFYENKKIVIPVMGVLALVITAFFMPQDPGVGPAPVAQPTAQRQLQEQSVNMDATQSSMPGDLFGSPSSAQSDPFAPVMPGFGGESDLAMGGYPADTMDAQSEQAMPGAMGLAMNDSMSNSVPNPVSPPKQDPMITSGAFGSDQPNPFAPVVAPTMPSPPAPTTMAAATTPADPATEAALSNTRAQLEAAQQQINDLTAQLTLAQSNASALSSGTGSDALLKAQGEIQALNKALAREKSLRQKAQADLAPSRKAVKSFQEEAKKSNAYAKELMRELENVAMGKPSVLVAQIQENGGAFPDTVSKNKSTASAKGTNATTTAAVPTGVIANPLTLKAVSAGLAVFEMNGQTVYIPEGQTVQGLKVIKVYPSEGMVKTNRGEIRGG